jgi:predicted glycoside hydrolase/deacetylase ChbG (UPF0249 family)
MDKKLIINADDFGLSCGISEGILLTHREGLLTSTSLMVNQPGTEYAVEQIPSVPELGVGIHLNLTQGRPVLAPGQVRTLVTQEGTFYSPTLLGKRMLRWQVSADEIEAEYRAQIRLMKSYGLTPTHADSHHRMHMYPVAARAFYKAITAEGIRHARAPRKRFWPTDGRLGGPHTGSLSRRLAAKSYLEFLQTVVFRSLSLPDAGVTFHPRFSGKLDLLEEAWRMTFEHLPPGAYEIWCHPGFVEKGFSETDTLSSQREIEIGILTDPRLRELTERREINLINFKAI